MKFVKIKLNSSDLMPCWWEYDDNTPIKNAVLKNMGFGKCSGIDLTGYEIIEANSWHDLNWKETIAYSSIYLTGWLSTNGEFYGCDYQFHDIQALYIHHKSSRKLEEAGFIKITKKLHSDEYFVLNASNITQKQYKWFKDNYTLPNREEVMSFLSWCLKLKKQEVKDEKSL